MSLEIEELLDTIPQTGAIHVVESLEVCVENGLSGLSGDRVRGKAVDRSGF